MKKPVSFRITVAEFEESAFGVTMIPCAIKKSRATIDLGWQKMTLADGDFTWDSSDWDRSEPSARLWNEQQDAVMTRWVQSQRGTPRPTGARKLLLPNPARRPSGERP